LLHLFLAEASMPYPELNDYLGRLPSPGPAPAGVWRNGAGQAVGRFFNCSLTSTFQPIRNAASFSLEGHEGLVRSVAAGDAGLSLWSLLEGAASDDQSVELDRLCRMLHAINFFRQPAAGAGDLYLNVHNRLLSAVSSNHGHAFKRIFGALGLPVGQVVLQLPAVTPAQGWLLNYVADNYSRNGFRLALNAGSYAQALGLLDQVRPHAIKLDAAALPAQGEIAALLRRAHGAGTRLVVKRVEGQATLALLERAADEAGVAPYVQGKLIDPARAELGPGGCRRDVSLKKPALTPVEDTATISLRYAW
jgi:EAL domain-containing protein (putative c-di-GMP-specific phosphodiesterase class I)